MIFGSSNCQITAAMFSQVGILPVEFGHLVIQVAVVHAIHHFALQNIFQFFQVEDHAGGGVGLAGDSHFQRVVVPVAMRIIALAEDAAVFFRRKLGL